MRPLLLLGAALAIAAVPVAAMLVLVIAGVASAAPTLAAIGATLLAAAALAAIGVHYLEALARTLRLAGGQDRAALLRAAASPLLPPVGWVARGIERLARTLDARAAQVGELLRSNETIVELLPDPLLVLAADRGVRRANAAARAAFGDAMGAVLRHPGLREAIERAFTDKRTQSAELALPVPAEREVQATVIYLDPKLADGAQAIVVLSDRSRERAVERMRADFVANASHELRTPLASLIGFVHTLRGPAADDPPAQRRFLAIMAEQAERMNRLIDDLLSLSRIELTEHQSPTDLVAVGPLVEGALAGFEPRLAARSMTLAAEITPDLPDITADADQVAQVVVNLVDNAIKYGAEGGTVRVRLMAAVPGGKLPSRPGLLLSVSDDGPGIARAHIARLTERFYRVDAGRSRAAGGTGLGLAIVKHIVSRHRGLLLIESEEGKGATFSVWLPVTLEARVAI